jgi:hypothetical protein
MDDWNGFYTLIGGTAGTLTGLIFVVIALGAKSAQARDADRTRLLVAPILVYFVTLLVVSLAMIPPLAQPTRALALGVIGCAGLFYTINLASLLRRLPKAERAEVLWELVLPISSYALLIFSAAAWALRAPFAESSVAIAAVILLIGALRKSWTLTLSIASRG